MRFLHSIFRRRQGFGGLLAALALIATLGLAGCAHGRSAPDQPAAATPGVTVYGTVDAGVGRSRR